ncbi:hypothetical protein DFH08DRAFT_956532 [Mycena albidolilacea]|uniref:Uncharacterized protein n=1 Tax=Mycena albidolilacea TaxID=1033008 RepID=A0AAD7AAM1_9AGAR|nr:hypothetical protein DFH08DRAFT_956532 [Mycena albidolilacea]
MAFTAPLTAEYLQEQLDRNGSFGLDDLKVIFFSLAIRPKLQSVKEALELIDKNTISVDWDFIRGDTIDDTKIVNTLLRDYVQRNLIQVPTLTPLSTPPDTPVKNKMELDNLPNGGAEEEAKPEPKAKKSWYGKIEDYEGTMLWDFVMFDPLVDVALYLPKIICINYATGDDSTMEVHRFNKIGFGPLQRHFPVVPDGFEAPETTFKHHVFIRTVVRSLATRLWPENITFDVFWRLPGFVNSEEFGPIATHYAYEGKTEWQVDKAHTIPVLGPLEACRVMLVYRPRHKQDEEDDEDDELPAVPAPQAPHPPPVVMPLAPIVPAVPAAQLGEDTEAINDATEIWLLSLFSDKPLLTQHIFAHT